MTDLDSIVPALREALNKRGYSELTAVQKAVLAPELAGADALVSAQTGSGKTVAFGLALAPTLLGDEDTFDDVEAPLALVVAPTRELALQVRRELEWLYGETGARIASCVGGMDYRTERRALERGAHIVVGTPGRLCDHIRRGSLDPSGLRAVVLDEADEMLDLGFREDLEFILDCAPEDRRTLLFSATVSPTIAALARKYQSDAVRITTIEETEQHGDIEYRVHPVATFDKENAIINVLRYYEAQNALVFCATRATVTHLTARFHNRGFAVVALSGELSQNERTHALQAMRDGRAKVCIATDVAARGIDLPNLDLVIHADLPTNAETLVHRSGRTGRAGRKGTSVVILPNNRRRQAERLLANAGIEAEWCKPPSAEDVRERDNERLLADPLLAEPVAEDEQPLAAQLLERYGADQVAAAFLRLQRAGKSAPEELADVRDKDLRKPEKRAPDVPRRPREDFDDGVWFSLSIGRRNRAEPRWILPMVCRAGNITKRDVGAIKLQDKETYVQIQAEAAEAFAAALGADGMIEDKVRVLRLEGRPDMTHSPRPGGTDDNGSDADGERKPYRRDKPAYEKKPYDKKSFDKKPYGKKPYGAKKDFGDKKPYQDRKPTEKRAPRDEAAGDERPFRKKKPYGGAETSGPREDRGPYKPKHRPERAAASAVDGEAPAADNRPKRSGPNPALDPNWKPGRKPAGQKGIGKSKGKSVKAKTSKGKSFKGKPPKGKPSGPGGRAGATGARQGMGGLKRKG